MTIRPMGSRVFVEVSEICEGKVGSIIIPGKHSEMTRYGKVLAVGEEVKKYVPGDKVIIAYYSGTGIDLLGTDFTFDTHRILEESEILAKYDQEE